VRLAKVADAKGDFLKCREISADSSTGKKCVEALARIP
jgi:hypothetical protein